MFAAFKAKPDVLQELTARCKALEQLAKEQKAAQQKVLEQLAATAETAINGAADEAAKRAAASAGRGDADLAAATAPGVGTPAPAPGAEPSEPPALADEDYVVADVVRLLTKAKDFKDCEAQVTAVTSAKVTVKLLNGPKKGMEKRFSKSQCQIIWHSVMRSSGTASTTVPAPATPTATEGSALTTEARAEDLYSEAVAKSEDEASESPPSED